MNGSQLHQLMCEGEPRSLQHWSYQAMLASFPYDANLAVTWGGILQFIGWLNDWPVLPENPHSGG